jgi:hypothetical protein
LDNEGSAPLRKPCKDDFEIFVSLANVDNVIPLSLMREANIFLNSIITSE